MYFTYVDMNLVYVYCLCILIIQAIYKNPVSKNLVKLGMRGSISPSVMI